MPSKAGAGSRAESATTRRPRRGAGPLPSRARTVLVRAARVAGTAAASRTTARINPSTTAASASVTEVVPARPSSPALSPTSFGVRRRPLASPTTAATRAIARYDASSRVATNAGPAPAARSVPTRRASSLIRPPTSTTSVASARITRSVLPKTATARSLASCSAWRAATSCQGSSWGRSAAASPAPYRCANAGAELASRSLRYWKNTSGSRALARAVARCLLVHTRPGCAENQPGRSRMHPIVQTWGYGGSAAETAMPTTRS